MNSSSLIEQNRWLKTSKGEPRGYIDFAQLKELWFHTGTVCNLSCPDCFERSGPGVHRLDLICLQDVKPYIDEALELGVRQFSFTGGEPFVNKQIIPILDYVLDFAPCLVLSNGTRPLLARFDEIAPLKKKKNSLSLRISLDYSEPEKHDAGRGKGMFELALESLAKLHKAGFSISVARRRQEDENTPQADAAYKPIFESIGIARDTPIISFPDLEKTGTPEITETCMRTFHTPHTRSAMMCAFSRMVIKQNGAMRVYACTLVDDMPFYDFGETLSESVKIRTMLKHYRCFSCFACGMSCSRL
ncbi:MAG: radical SAM protein [Desulfobacteraceae bacterium]|nr:radical SAM protein [Desulfobacteraceae bacterium]